jgi:two-component system chemotaxis response regulator CheB
MPGDPLRVLVVDDSATSRALLTALCDADPSLEVVAEAVDGATGLQRAAELRPDVIVMDIFMPGMDGYAATRRIMVEMPTPVILVSAAADPRSREIGLRSLEAGALAVLCKPAGDGPEAVAFVAKVRALADVKVIRRYDRHPAPAGRAPKPVLASRRTPVGLVAVAASTGGPAALRRMIAALPNDLGVPIVVVQHIVEGFTSGLVAWLDQSCALPVRLARDGASLGAGTVHVGPDGVHLEVTPSGHVRLSASPAVGGFRPAATRLFLSAAQAYGSQTLAVVLTGMGGDGLEGVRAVHAAGGLVLAQDEATSVVFGMPGVVVREGLAHEVGPVERLAATIERSVMKGPA